MPISIDIGGGVTLECQSETSFAAGDGYVRYVYDGVGDGISRDRTTESKITITGANSVTVDSGVVRVGGDWINFDMGFGILGTGSLIIPSSVKEIGHNFAESYIGAETDLDLSNVEYIGDNAFYCVMLMDHKLTLGSNLRYIGANAFALTGFNQLEVQGRLPATVGDGCFSFNFYTGVMREVQYKGYDDIPANSYDATNNSFVNSFKDDYYPCIWTGTRWIPVSPYAMNNATQKPCDAYYETP